jgi:hypothetical protein
MAEKNLFKEAKNEMAFAKIGMQGFNGSGKTFTASKIAIGLHKYANLKKPVAFLDTETGSDFVIPEFKAAKVELVVFKSRAFVDLVAAIKEAEKNYSILLIDSITHFWTELQDSFMAKRNVKRIALHHWIELKRDWRQFSDAFINSKVHIIFCGRAGWDFDHVEDDEGAKELQRTGTKMKVEAETGFEPSLLLEMERVRTDNQKVGAGIINRCWVLKDRANKIQSMYFDTPVFENFLPHIKALNIGGTHKAMDTSRTSEAMHKQDWSNADNQKKRLISLELLKDELDLRYPGRTDEEKIMRIKTLKSIYGTSSKTEIENLPLDKLEDGMDKLRKLKKGGKE